VADGAEPQKPTTSPAAHIIYSRPLPSSGGSENECIHTERRSSTGDKMNCIFCKKAIVDCRPFQRSCDTRCEGDD